MTHTILHTIQNLLRHRYIVVLLSIFTVECVALLAYLAVLIQPTELQVVVHYTGFGTTNFYRDKWVYLLTFIVFVIISWLIHFALTYRMLVVKNAHLASVFAWFGIVLIPVTAAFFYQVLKIAALS